jgi:hypothetical protein
MQKTSNIKDAIFTIIRVFEILCMHGLWKKLLPHHMDDFIGFNLPLAMRKLKI